jgi:hypothetical protein
MRARAVVVLFALVLAACAEAGDEPQEATTDSAASDVTNPCPTASLGKPTYLFWHTTRQLEHLVWASDGQSVGAVEYIFEERKSWNPLNGTTDKRKFCHQLSVYDKNLKFVSYVGPMQPNQAGEISFMKPTAVAPAMPPPAYFTVMTYVRDFDGWDFHRVSLLDGSRKLLAHTPVGCQYGRMLPSPDGKLIAYFDIAGHCNDGLSGNDVKVTFFDGATGATIATSTSVNLPGGAAVTWTPGGYIVATDGTKSVKIALVGTNAVVSNTTLPGCTDPGTSSSDTGPDGRILGFDANGKPAIVGTNASGSFGCQ